MSTWWSVVIAAAVVFVLRAAFVVGSGHMRVPTWFERIGRHIAPAMAAALLAPRVVGSAGGWSVGTPGPATVAYLVALPVALRTRSVGWTLCCGMVVLWIAGAVV